MSDRKLDARIASAREVIARATPGPLAAAGGYLTARNPDGVSFLRSIYHLREIGQDRGASPFQAIPFARREDAERAALAWNALPALLDVVEAWATLSDGPGGTADDAEVETWQRESEAVLDAALARLNEVLP